MSTTTEATAAVERVTEADQSVDVRVWADKDAEVGKCVHQGDVYLHRVADDHLRGEELGTRQVAVGEGVGSRHVAEGGGVTVYEGEALPEWVTPDAEIGPEAYLGPVVVAKERWTLTHPAHAHHSVPAGVYAVTYPVNPTERRRDTD